MIKQIWDEVLQSKLLWEFLAVLSCRIYKHIWDGCLAKAKYVIGVSHRTFGVVTKEKRKEKKVERENWSNHAGIDDAANNDDAHDRDENGDCMRQV